MYQISNPVSEAEAPALTSPHEFAARAVAEDVELRMDTLMAEAEQGHAPAQALLGSYYMWQRRAPFGLLAGEWLVQNAICYTPMPRTWDWPVTGQVEPHILIDHRRDDTTIWFTDMRGAEQ